MWGPSNIELNEEFDKTAASQLKPAVGSAQNDTLKNGVTKKVTVENTGNEEAYVRVHIAIPKLLDNADASNNILHFNYEKDSVGADKWDWSDTAGAPYEGNWNTYDFTDTDGVEYTVYVVTYERALNSGETTENAIHQVYLDSKATQEQIQDLQKVLGKDWNILVKAEAVQADGFDNAYTALNEAFGAPSWD